MTFIFLIVDLYLNMQKGHVFLDRSEYLSIAFWEAERERSRENDWSKQNDRLERGKNTQSKAD